MNRLVRILRNSRGWSQLAPYLEQRRQQPTTTRGWWFWPFCMLVWSMGLALTLGAVCAGATLNIIGGLVWLTLFAYMVWPARRVWLLHRTDRRKR